jgi:ethanolaminephosphotransferase
VHLPPYLNEEDARNLKKYRYAGGDFGLMYIYFYNPVSKWLVNHIPRTLAPNVITLTGFIFTVAPFMTAFTYFGSKFESEEPTIP